MSRIVYVNGAFLPEEDAKISVFDRGFLFGDGIYEVASILDGKLIDNQRHLARLQRSLDELGMRPPLPLEELPPLQHEMVRRNGVTEGMLYLQITRGAADRDFGFTNDPQPSLVMFTQARTIRETPASRSGIRVGFSEDIRWKRRDIKTTMLLAQSLAKQGAKDAGFDDVWMVEDGHVTEGSSNNAFIVTVDGRIITRHLGNEILHGITRRVVLDIAAELGLTVEERAFTPDEAKAAAEAFSTSASSFVMPVVAIDGTTISQGVPGPITARLRARYIEVALEMAESAA